MRFVLLLLLLVCLGRPGFGQAANLVGKHTLASSSSAPPPALLLWQLRTLPQRPSFDDSLAHHYYAQNRVKSVMLIRFFPYMTRVDTVEYSELDHAGYAVLIVNPASKQRVHLRYNRRHQCISYTKDAAPQSPLVVQTIFDPAAHTTTTRVGPTLATLELSQTGRNSQQNGTSAQEVFLLATPRLPPPPVSRILLTTKKTSGDTLRLDALGYRNEEVVKAESYYAIGRAPQQRESGTIVLPQPGRASQPLVGHYIPTHRSTYNAAGWLIRTQSIPAPRQLADKPVTYTSPDGKSSTTVGPATDTTTTTYLRNAHGQVLREEHRSTYVLPSDAPPNSKLTGPSFTTYDYLSNGLLRSKADNQGIRYEYHYTFY